LIKGVLSAIGDTDVTGDSKKSRSRPTGDHEDQRTVKIKYEICGMVYCFSSALSFAG